MVRKSNPTSKSIASILRKSDYTPYWKPSNCANIRDIHLLIHEEILPGGKFVGIVIQDINVALNFTFLMEKKN
ncbi:hypothetical protein C1645_823746 [Glomus cerebriforme]|uniref:Uncharacterized protein n=1 Tax=Glomus cerebriforme TaxID=658196 RepID=A0A397T1K7_9GLOM|nr:hypothetical protein C1645_823746 [Glomus cerebriforme]